MKGKLFVPVLIALFSSVSGGEIPGVPRDSNTGNTGGYAGTRVEAQLLLNVKDHINAVHFIRDNNDPRVITKTYILKHVDPYEFRDYLRQMVQSKRVGNTNLQQQYPGNSGNPPVATVSAPELNSASSQPGFSPQVQLGSNTAVECLQYVDGTGLLIVSAEEYRFKDHKNGMGIDTLVSMLDNPSMGPLSFGSQMFIYMPKFVPAKNLMPLIENMGMNIQDVTELWQGTDLVAYDPDLNWLIFDVANYSSYNIAAMLEKYDVPIPQVRLKISIYEIYKEHDDKIGIDFQNWKNNEGADFFSAGGRYRNNWAAIYNQTPSFTLDYGSERTSFYNFNPKWNTRYLDFLVSKGKAKIAHTGELCIRNASSAFLNRVTQIFYIDTSKPVKDLSTLPDTGVGPYELLSALVGEALKTDLPVGKGNQQIVTRSNAGYGFTLNVKNVSVNLEETSFEITASNTSLIGFESNGTPRIAPGNTVNQTISLPHGKNRFVIGGLRKQETVKSRTGIPWLCRIPYLEYIFGTVTTSTRYADLVIVGECEWASPSTSEALALTKKRKKGLSSGKKGNTP